MDDGQTAAADWREERLAQNEVFFRTVNEGIEQQAIRFGGDDDYEFICECASRACLDRVSLTLREYEHVRAAGTRFVVVPGHENIEVELVVETAPNVQRGREGRRRRHRRGPLGSAGRRRPTALTEKEGFEPSMETFIPITP